MVLVQRVVLPASGRESWTVLGDDDAPVAPIESYLAFLSDIERSPNTVKAYAHLCRSRHNMPYAEPPDMPLLGVKLLAGWSVMPCSIGIIFGLLHIVTD